MSIHGYRRRMHLEGLESRKMLSVNGFVNHGVSPDIAGHSNSQLESGMLPAVVMELTDQVEFQVGLEVLQQVPPGQSPATGLATLVLNTLTGQLAIQGDFVELQGEVLGVHLHGPATLGNQADEILSLEFSGYNEGVFSTAATLAIQQINDVINGRTYLEIHSSAISAGEIRGQIAPIGTQFRIVGQGESGLIRVGDSFDIEFHAWDQASMQSVFSAYVDIFFDATLIEVTEIVFSDSFLQSRTGGIQNHHGQVDEVGAVGKLIPDNETLVFTLRVMALAVGSTKFEARPADSIFSDISVIGLDGDQRENTYFKPLPLTISPVRPWQNPRDAGDVNDDGIITPVDVFLIASRIVLEGAGALSDPLPTAGEPPPYYDVSGDGFVAANDVFLVANTLNTLHMSVANLSVWSMVPGGSLTQDKDKAKVTDAEIFNNLDLH